MTAARNHHYVPVFLLRRWAYRGSHGQELVDGFWWDAKLGRMVGKRLGPKGFCYSRDLFTYTENGQPISDVEVKFFGSLDSRGANALSTLLRLGSRGLSDEIKRDITEVLLSLEARRPDVVAALRTVGAAFLREQLNSSMDILEAIRSAGLNRSPADLYERVSGVGMPDAAMLLVQHLSKSQRVGDTLMRSSWGTKCLGSGDGYFLLTDRPFVAYSGFRDPEAFWLCPMSPTSCLFIARTKQVFTALDDVAPREFRRRANRDLTYKVAKYAFLAEHAQSGKDRSWLEGRLKEAHSHPERSTFVSTLNGS